MLFIIVAVVPFSASLYVSSSLLSQHMISPNDFLTTLLFPPILLPLFIRSRLMGPRNLSEHDEMLAQIYLKDIYGPFRISETTEKPVRWESVLILRKLALVCASTFIVHPVGKLYTMLTLLVMFLYNHLRVQPYQDKMLNGVETCCMIMLCVLCSVNLFWAYLYMSREVNIPHYRLIGEVFLFFEVVVLVLPVLVVVVLFFYKMSKKLFNTYKAYTYKQD